MSPPPPTGGRHIVFGSVVVAICIVFVCVIPCEHDDFWGVLNFIFKLEPGIGHIMVSDELETSDLGLDLQGQIGLEPPKFCF